MGRRGAVWLAWGVTAAAAAIVALTWLLFIMNQAGPVIREPGTEDAWALASGTLLIFCLPGAVIISRRPANLVGWILVAIGMSYGLSGFVTEYGTYALVTAPGALPAGTFALWLGWPLYDVGFGLAVPLLFLFPTGRPPSREWRPAVWVTLAAILALVPQPALSPGRLGYDFRLPSNPIGLEDAQATLDTVIEMALLLLLLSALYGLASLRVRYRQSQGEERQQLKWFFYGAVILLVALPVGTVFSWSGNFIPIFAGFGSFTVCIAIAMLRYRLYDIDRLINRTLVYGLLTALLGTVYASVVLVLGQLFATIGAGSTSWVVAAATLAAAALFQPGRRRIQAAEDRRFNRRRYDVARTVEAFSARLRDQIDLDTLSAELLAVTDQTMQPHQAWLWLRPSTDRVRHTGV